MQLSPAAARRLESYAFPGNIIELRGIVQRAAVVAETAAAGAAAGARKGGGRKAGAGAAALEMGGDRSGSSSSSGGGGGLLQEELLWGVTQYSDRYRCGPARACSVCAAALPSKAHTPAACQHAPAGQLTCPGNNSPGRQQGAHPFGRLVTRHACCCPAC